MRGGPGLACSRNYSREAAAEATSSRTRAHTKTGLGRAAGHDPRSAAEPSQSRPPRDAPAGAARPPTRTAEATRNSSSQMLQAHLEVAACSGNHSTQAGPVTRN